jgi:hypothetical protein
MRLDLPMREADALQHMLDDIRFRGSPIDPGHAPLNSTPGAMSPSTPRQHLPTLTTAAAALAVLLIGVRYGTFVAADTDPYSYVSQADLIAAGTLRIDQSFARALPWIDPELAFAPPGYTLGADKRFIVPVHASGLPLIMAAFQRLAGDRQAVYFVVPLLAALAVWMTARLGNALHGPATGAAAAVLLAANPVFLFQVPQPVSDVPATAWWTMAFAFACGASTTSAVVAGAATSMAIATRPNLVPFAAAVGGYLLWRVVRSGTTARRAALLRAIAFCAAALPGCLFVALLNQYLHGSPLMSGYGPLGDYFRLEHVGPNLDRYPRWLLETGTAYLALALAAPLVAGRNANRAGTSCNGGAMLDAGAVSMLLAFIVGLFAMTIFYGYFGREEWVYLRLLLPAYPAAIVLSVVVAQQLAGRLAGGNRHRASALGLLAVAVLTGWSAREAVRRGVFNIHVVERRYLDVGRHIAAATPGTAAFITGIHAGSVRYYSGRSTLYFPQLYRRALDLSIVTLREMGHHPYILLEAGEEEHFARRFGENSPLARLDWPARYETVEGTKVRIWDPADRARFVAGETISTGKIEPHVR